MPSLLVKSENRNKILFVDLFIAALVPENLRAFVLAALAFLFLLFHLALFKNLLLMTGIIYWTKKFKKEENR